MIEHHLSASEETDISPDTGVAVPDAVQERKVPAYGHQHRYILADLSVASVTELSGCPPGLGSALARTARFIDRVDLDCKDIAPVTADIVGHIYELLVEHPRNKADHLAVEPELRPVVDSIHLHPDTLILRDRHCIELRPEPVGVEIPSGDADVRYKPGSELVVQPEIRLGIDTVIDQGVEDCSRYDRRHPAFGPETRFRQILCTGGDFGRFLHLPSGVSSMPIGGLEGKEIVPAVGRWDRYGRGSLR